MAEVVDASKPVCRVHVVAWSLAAGKDAEAFKRLVACLSADEHAAGARRATPELRDAYISARGGLRQVLGHCLDIAPEEIAFNIGSRGKPEVVVDAARRGGLQFNLSHSGRTAVAALSRDYAVGVDIEAVRPVSKKLARRYFSSHEANVLETLPPDRAQQAFFDFWVAKEACLKATGGGIAAGLDVFAFALPQALRPAEGCWLWGEEMRPESVPAVHGHASEWVVAPFACADHDTSGVRLDLGRDAGLKGAIACRAGSGGSLAIDARHWVAGTSLEAALNGWC